MLKFPFYAKMALIIIGLFAFVSMLFITQRIIVPIIYSTIIAIVLSPIVNFFVRKKINRVIAIAVTLIVFIAIASLIITLLTVQMMQFSDSFPQFLTKFHQLADLSLIWTSQHFGISKDKINLLINQKTAEILNSSSSLIGQTILNTGSGLVVLLLIPVYVFMILVYQSHLITFIHKLFSADKSEEVSEVLTATKKIIQSYLVGLLLEALIIAVLDSTALLILGIDYAILFGVMGAIINVIPFIGGILAVAFPLLIALVTKSPNYALLVVASYMLIQFVDNHFIVPKVVASKVKINALISIIVVLAGSALWGFPGMFVSIPLIAIIKVIFDHIEPLKPWGFLLGNPEDYNFSFIKKRNSHQS
ncbi:AI-2E family transporter [Emticicia sp. SJ17W-69]|uniref:AI-2E family transporter n=1 Tax=Emticicia sp. SJ17W-69 TaxID=3421657 RepID=UPI003EB85DBA